MGNSKNIQNSEGGYYTCIVPNIKEN